MGPLKETFSVGDQNMNPRQKGFDLLRSVHDFPGMTEPRFFQGITVNHLSVGLHGGIVFVKERIGQILGVLIKKLLGYLHPRERRPAFFIGTNSDKGGLLGLRFSLSDGSGSKECFIQLYEPGELIAFVPVRHGTPDLMGHEPNGLVGTDPEESLGLHHRDPVLIATHEENQPEPDFKGHMGLVEDGPCGQGDLGPALFALIKPARPMQARSTGIAAGAFETTGPALSLQMFAARQFCGETALYG